MATIPHGVTAATKYRDTYDTYIDVDDAGNIFLNVITTNPRSAIIETQIKMTVEQADQLGMQLIRNAHGVRMAQRIAAQQARA